ncbi:hypothetical protein DV735_g3296, partial [Chaetothyriales sp. CBS 134920]
MSYYNQAYQPAGQPNAAQNLQFFSSSYPAVSGHTTPSQATYGGYGAVNAAPAYPGYGPTSAVSGFGAAPGLSGRISDQGSGLRTGWLAAFGTEGYEGEPSLMEELGVNFDHIKTKTVAVLNPWTRPSPHIMDDSDLYGGLLFLVLYGTFLALSGKFFYGYIYGIALFGSIALHWIFALMSPTDADQQDQMASAQRDHQTHQGGHFSSTLTYSRSASVLGYCFLPLTLTALFGVALPMDTPLGYLLTAAAVGWCTYSSSGMFVSVARMSGMRGLVAYPLALFYSGFGIMGIFSSRGTDEMEVYGLTGEKLGLIGEVAKDKDTVVAAAPALPEWQRAYLSKPSISIRKGIAWGYQAPYEDTDTIVLTAPSSRFVDIRLPRKQQHDPSGPLADHPAFWAITGTSSTVFPGTQEAPFPHVAHGQWKHDIDSKGPGITDEGDMFVLENGDVAEVGIMANPQTGRDEMYKEYWTSPPAPTAAEVDTPSTRGLAITIGDYFQAILLSSTAGQAPVLSVERWTRQTPSSPWTRDNRSGNASVAASSEQNDSSLESTLCLWLTQQGRQQGDELGEPVATNLIYATFFASRSSSTFIIDVLRVVFIDVLPFSLLQLWRRDTLPNQVELPREEPDSGERSDDQRNGMEMLLLAARRQPEVSQHSQSADPTTSNEAWLGLAYILFFGATRVYVRLISSFTGCPYVLFFGAIRVYVRLISSFTGCPYVLLFGAIRAMLIIQTGLLLAACANGLGQSLDLVSASSQAIAEEMTYASTLFAYITLGLFLLWGLQMSPYDTWDLSNIECYNCHKKGHLARIVIVFAFRLP